MIKELNELYGEFLEHKITPTLLVDMGDSGMTIVDADTEVFELKPSVAGRSIMITPVVDNGKDQICVIRQLPLQN